MTELPHHDVRVRLGCSKINGIGVFAIERIAKGTNLFANDFGEIVWIAKSRLEEANLTPAERKLYQDFGVRRGQMIGCPVNFHNLTPGWYLNQPAFGEIPNVIVDDELSFFTDRDVAEGEELTVRYSTFSDADQTSGTIGPS